jgi:hypothetical protein
MVVMRPVVAQGEQLHLLSLLKCSGDTVVTVRMRGYKFAAVLLS